MIIDLERINPESSKNKDVFDEMLPSTDEKITYSRNHKVNF